MDSLRELWEEEGPKKIVSWYMELDRSGEEITDKKKSWVAAAFAEREWNEKAIEMADQIEEDSARGEYARGVALWRLERREEAIQALRRSLEIEDHLGRKELLADYLIENAKLDGAGQWEPDPGGENEVLDLHLLMDPAPRRGLYDYSHSRYDRPKELLWDCLEMGEPQSEIVQGAAVRLAQLGTSEEEVVEVLQCGTKKGSSRSRFELAIVESFLSSDIDETNWLEVWEVFQEAGEDAVGAKEEKSVEGEKGGIFEAYVEFAALAAQQNEDFMDESREYPGRFYELGLRLISQADALEVSQEEIAVLCGRAAALSGDLETGAMFYEEASEASSAFAETTAQIEEAALKLRLAEKESGVSINRRTELLKKIVQASKRALDREFKGCILPGVMGIRSSVLGYMGPISVTNLIQVSNIPLLKEAISRIVDSDQFEKEAEAVVQTVCPRLCSGCGKKREEWREGNLIQAALKCEAVQNEVDTVRPKSKIDRVKTAQDRWPDLDYYPKKLLATLTAVDGKFSVEDLAELSGQRQRYIESNVHELLKEGMLVSSPAVGPIWIEGIGGVQVNPQIEDLARRERSHEVKSQIIDSDEDLKAKQVFDSDGEYKIYRTLTETFPNALVFPNMSPGAIFDYDEMKGALTSKEFKYFLQSRVDFCIVSTDSYLPILAIEVDSHYHDREKQKERDKKKDKVFRVGGVPLIRLRRYGSQSDEAVANQVREKIQELVERDAEEAKMLRIANVEI